MKLYEKWYAIESVKGYVLTTDYITIESTLKSKLGIYGNVNFIKKRDFILVIITSKKPLIKINTIKIYNILKNKSYRKLYSIKHIGNEETIYDDDSIDCYIGVPY